MPGGGDGAGVSVDVSAGREQVGQVAGAVGEPVPVAGTGQALVDDDGGGLGQPQRQEPQVLGQPGRVAESVRGQPAALHVWGEPVGQVSDGLDVGVHVDVDDG